MDPLLGRRLDVAHAAAEVAPDTCVLQPVDQLLGGKGQGSGLFTEAAALGASCAVGRQVLQGAGEVCGDHGGDAPAVPGEVGDLVLGVSGRGQLAQ